VLESQQKRVYTDLTKLTRELPHSTYLSRKMLIKTMSSEKKNPPKWLQDFKVYSIVPTWILEAFESGCACPLCERIRNQAEELRRFFAPRRRPEATDVV